MAAAVPTTQREYKENAPTDLTVVFATFATGDYASGDVWATGLTTCLFVFATPVDAALAAADGVTAVASSGNVTLTVVGTKRAVSVMAIGYK